MSSANCAEEVPWVHTIGTSSSRVDGDDLGAVGDLVAAAGQLVAVVDGDGEVGADVDDRVEVAGQPDERRVEPVEVVAQHRLVVARRVGGHEDHLHLLAVGLVEPGQRRGQRGHHDLADVGAVGVAEEDQGQRLVGVGGERERLAVGVGQRGVGHDVRLVEHRGGVAVVVPLAGSASPPQPASASSASRQAGREQPVRRAGSPTPHPGGEVVGEGGERAQPGGPVVGVVEQDAHEGGADDHAVGVRRHLGGLVAGADAEPDPHRQVGVAGLSARVRATSGAARSLVVARAPVTPMTAVA